MTIQMKAIEQYFQVVLFLTIILQNEIHDFPLSFELSTLGPSESVKFYLERKATSAKLAGFLSTVVFCLSFKLSPGAKPFK